MTGVGSVFSYPVLIAIGLAPTSANVTNTVALAIGGATGAYRSRPDIVGYRRLTIHLCIASVLGTLVGSALLLASPPKVFEAVVPFLVAAASLSILVPRPTRSGGDDQNNATPPAAIASLSLVSIYNGYFAAGSSVLMIAALLATTSLTLGSVNGVRNVLVLVSDLAAAVSFAVFGPVAWTAVPPLVVGLLIGSWFGPPIARRLPVAKLRALIALAGLGLAVYLAIGAFRS